MRHLIANLVGSIMGARSATRAPNLPCGFFSHPTALGRPVDASAAADKLTTPNLLFQALSVAGNSPSLQHKTRRVVAVGYRVWRYASKLRSGQPGFVGSADGSKNAIVCDAAGTLA